MKNLITSGIAFLFICLSSLVQAQIKNAKTETVKVYGNCSMCKETIEKAINQKNVVAADWNKDTKLLTLTYDARKTTKKDLLKKVAEAGYDNEMFRAPDTSYKKLPQCCLYKRPGSLTEPKKTN